MPTGAKLTGAIVFYFVGWLAAYFTIFTLPEGMPVGNFQMIVGAIGLWQGWMVAGTQAGKGWQASINAGIRTSVQIAFFALLIYSIRMVFVRSSRLIYDGPGEATIAGLELFLEYLLQILTLPIWTTLMVGGILGGLICEWAARRWR